MLRISKTKISITRGDSAYIEIGINNPDGTDYELQEGDTVQCQVRTMANTGELLIDASIENGKLYFEDDVLTWHLVPEDTKDLEIGTYYYDIQLVTAAGDVFTFIENSPFKITDEVTYDE